MRCWDVRGGEAETRLQAKRLAQFIVLTARGLVYENIA